MSHRFVFGTKNQRLEMLHDIMQHEVYQLSRGLLFTPGADHFMARILGQPMSTVTGTLDPGYQRRSCQLRKGVWVGQLSS